MLVRHTSLFFLEEQKVLLLLSLTDANFNYSKILPRDLFYFSEIIKVMNVAMRLIFYSKNLFPHQVKATCAGIIPVLPFP